MKVLSWEAVFGTGFFGTIDLDRTDEEEGSSEVKPAGMDPELSHDSLENAVAQPEPPIGPEADKR